ncbi:hypothetical protein CYL20_08080 [Pseudomonas palleroniana]|uniref:Uncharacterized protein n=1 Tax=Pseudomonas palleroniana TaxID=191390 RepID=A0A2L1J7M6_9PSED|nr:hypothetical protein CYL20_08080 [Pseudomonas palleroniana]NCE86098.1 hypothetical protein [Pseudomonas sp. Q1]
MEVKATVIVWLPDYELLWRISYTGARKNLDAKLLQGEGASSLTLWQLRIYEIDSQALFLKDTS